MKNLMIIVLASLMSISAFANSFNYSEESINVVCYEAWEVLGTKELKTGLPELLFRCYIDWKVVTLESTTNSSLGKISVWVNHKNYSTYTFVNGSLTSWTER